MWTTASTANFGKYRISSGRHKKLKAHIMLAFKESQPVLPKSALETVQQLCNRRPLHIPGFSPHGNSIGVLRNVLRLTSRFVQSFKLDPTSGKSTVGDQEAEHYFAKSVLYCIKQEQFNMADLPQGSIETKVDKL